MEVIGIGWMGTQTVANERRALVKKLPNVKKGTIQKNKDTKYLFSKYYLKT